MSAEMTMGFVIITIVAMIMVVIGMVQMTKRDVPVGFYNMIDPPKKEEITDINMWNKKHGLIWITYGLCIELGFGMGCIMPTEALEMICMMGGVVFPLPFMVMKHKSLEKIYMKK